MNCPVSRPECDKPTPPGPPGPPDPESKGAPPPQTSIKSYRQVQKQKRQVQATSMMKGAEQLVRTFTYVAKKKGSDKVAKKKKKFDIEKKFDSQECESEMQKTQKCMM